jgi:putative membrane protein
LEGAQDLKTVHTSSSHVMPDSPVASAPAGNGAQILLITIIILFHLVGLIGLSIPSLRPLFLKIVPWHLLLMLVVIIISHKPVNGSFLLFALLIFITGFFAEWVGIHKNWLFGNYNYGDTLGIKLDAVPLTIGINWFLLIYATGVLMERSRIRSIFIRVITGALLLVLLDVLIEPVAMRFDYWHWANGLIPIKNYVCWFAVSAVMLFVFEQFRFKKQSMVAPVLLITEFLFFAVLHFMW